MNKLPTSVSNVPSTISNITGSSNIVPTHVAKYVDAEGIEYYAGLIGDLKVVCINYGADKTTCIKVQDTWLKLDPHGDITILGTCFSVATVKRAAHCDNTYADTVWMGEFI